MVCFDGESSLLEYKVANYIYHLSTIQNAEIRTTNWHHHANLTSNINVPFLEQYNVCPPPSGTIRQISGDYYRIHIEILLISIIQRKNQSV